MSRTFNGTSNFITIGPNTSIDTVGRTLSLMAWIYLTSYAAAYSVIEMSVGENGGGTDLFLFVNNNGVLNGFVPADGALAISESNSPVVPLNTWTHVAMTYNDTTDRLVYLYVNGVDVGSYATQNPAVGTIIEQAGYPTYIGNDEYGDFFSGNIAEVRIYDVQANPTQMAIIATDANGTVDAAGLGSDLVAYLHLCGTMSPEPDATGNGNVGVLTGTGQGPDSPGFNCSGTPPILPWSSTDSRVNPNASREVNQTKTYDVQTSSNSAVPGTDSRVSKPVASGTYPQNSRTPGLYGPGEN